MALFTLQPSITAEWQSLIKEAENNSQLHLNEELEVYLVFLLGRFNKNTEFAHTLLAIEFLENVKNVREPSCDKLQEVGDKCLLLAGLFPKRVEKTCLKISYYIELGQAAYTKVAILSSKNLSSLYFNLSRCFVSLMEVLHAIRALTECPLPPLQATDLWNDVQSPYALRLLRQHRIKGLPFPGPNTQH